MEAFLDGEVDRLALWMHGMYVSAQVCQIGTEFRHIGRHTKKEINVYSKWQVACYHAIKHKLSSEPFDLISIIRKSTPCTVCTVYVRLCIRVAEMRNILRWCQTPSYSHTFKQFELDGYGEHTPTHVTYQSLIDFRPNPEIAFARINLPYVGCFNVQRTVKWWCLIRLLQHNRFYRKLSGEVSACVCLWACECAKEEQ